MLAELETGLIALVKQSPLGARLRQVDSLPDLDGDTLVGRFLTDAPAVYVALGSFPVRNRYARPKYGIACVARNSRSHQAARHGDGVAIGLYEMLEAVMAMVDGAPVGYAQGGLDEAVCFEVVSCDLVNSEALQQKGLYVGIVQLQASAEVSLPGVPDTLSDFETFQADYDIDPHQLATEHEKWLQEPADHGTSAPELSDTLPLHQE